MSESEQTVLVVDDESLNIELIKAILSKDCNVVGAADGTEALGFAASDSPDLILLDIMMPGMDGYEVCRRLKSDPLTSDIPVVFLTALGKIEQEVKGLELGAIDYIAKPINPEVVKVRVRNHLELKRYRDTLKTLSLRDGLTGIANRRAFNDFLDQEWRRAMRNNAWLSLLMIDIDHFKPFNDNYGHGAGDDCLISVARALEATLKRPADHVARYGGEEFACVLPETDAKGAAQMAETLCHVVRDLSLKHEFSLVGDTVTVSVGGASLQPAAGSDPGGLLEIADGRLYAAKSAGRNQSICAAPAAAAGD
ncbi:MAG: diguanylate cyclase [Alphaproteobacteria bacterium]|jgi:diguanylate cyclase (GGDEF)-like protein|nr:diguanylate cyclase [Alphaproteobacteria bacterium]|tara:strand:- start:554 stop:1480 length:927 start_codon:yes stop_codon:yes gene_type:complete